MDVSVMQEEKLVLLGLDKSGKTSTMYKIVGKTGSNPEELIPTIGFNAENMVVENIKVFYFNDLYSFKMNKLDGFF